MNTCPNCQARNHDQASFCAHCGQPLPQVTHPLPSAPSQTSAPAPTDLSALEPARREHNGGVEVSGGQVQVGGDVAGRDVVKVTQTGLGASAVQRLVLTIGGLVLAVGFCFSLTATCFFSGGVVLSATVFVALNRPVETSPEAAQRMEQKLRDLNALSPGQTFSITTTEVESSSYLRFILGPKIGVGEPKVRYLAPGRIVVGGWWSALGDLPFAATFRVGEASSTLKLEGAAVQVLQISNSNFGWVAVPNLLVESQFPQVTSPILSQLKVTTIVDVSPSGPAVPHEWQVAGVRR